MTVKLRHIGTTAEELTELAESRKSSRAEATDLILALYLWFVIYLLCALGNIGNIAPGALGLFISIGGVVLSATVFVLLAAAAYIPGLFVAVFISYLVMIALPAGLFPEPGIANVMFLDLYLILLVSIPALLRLWTWRLQCAASLLVVFADLALWYPAVSLAAAFSVFLVGSASALSTLVAYLHSSDVELKEFHRERETAQLLDEVLELKLSRRIWSVVLLEAGLLVVLLFLDIAVLKEAFSVSVVSKVYGLIALVFASLIIAISPPKILPLAIGATTVLVGLAISVSQAKASESEQLYGALSLIYLSFVSIGLPWGLRRQIGVVWCLLLSEVIVRVISNLSHGSDWLQSVSSVFLSSRVSLLLIALGTALSVAISWVMRRYHFAYVVSAIDQEITKGSREGESAGRRPESGRLLVRSFGEAEPEMTPRLVVGLLIVGIFSCVVSTEVLVSSGRQFGSIALTGWAIFLLLWLVLMYLERSQFPREQLWFFGAFVALLLLMWPAVLLMFLGGTQSLWVFWPILVCFGIGAIPWSVREIVPLSLVAIIVGVELGTQLNAGDMAAFGSSVVTVVCVVYSLANRQSLVEKNLLRGIHEALTQAVSEVELLRTVGDYLMTLYGCGSAMISLGTNHLEFLRGGKYFPLHVNEWPLHALRERFGTTEKGGVAVRPVNWLSSAFRLFDIRFGAFSPSSGILFESRIARKEQSLEEVENPGGSSGRDLIVFLGFPFPYMGWIRSWKRRIAESIGHAGISRLEGFYEQQVTVELGRRAENWKAEREYELSALVHDVNNTVQDLTLLCEAMLEQVADLRKSQPEQLQAVLNTDRLIADIERITIIARSVATVISDAKRRRELEKLEDLTPRELVEITNVVAEVISFAVLRAERKRIKVISSVPSSEKLWVRFSVREHLETILRNLINNAILYSSPGSEVEVSVFEDQNWVIMKVRDTGPGLTASECEAVFKAGYRGKSAKGVKGGLGIGLAESRRVTESAGGTLDAVSDGPGKGTTFIVKLPRQFVAAPSEAEQWALLVDDQPVLTDVYAKIAKALDLRAETAATLEEAVSILDRLGKPSLVLTDVHLGTGDGLDLVRYARQEFGKGLPILVVSGLGDSDIVERVLLAGATDFVAKPVSRRALFARMQSLLFKSASS